MFKKGFITIEVLTIILVIIALASIIISIVLGGARKAHACGFFTECSTPANELKAAATVQADLVTAVPVPQLQTSLERENVSKRAQIFNTPDKISYIYLVSYGKVMAFYTVKGKVSSLQSYMVPTEKLVKGNGEPCTYYSTDCWTVNSADIDGTYGENVEGIFFFTTEGAYVEWKGEYMMSDQPLKLATPPALVREIK